MRLRNADDLLHPDTMYCKQIVKNDNVNLWLKFALFSWHHDLEAGWGSKINNI
jgi:hypothetical protein